jgi:pimeloyl-ACP methyl ester carboxylesterase
MNYQQHHYQSFDGLSLYYREYGEGEKAIICLPGLTRNSKDFHALASHLAGPDGGGWRVLCPDLRGRGQSQADPNWKQYLPPTYVRDTWTLLDRLGIEQVVVIGTSLGGLMAMLMADQQPQRLRGVVLNDVGPEITPESRQRIMSYVGRTPPQADMQAAVAQVKNAYALAFPDMPEAFWAEITANTWRHNDDGTVQPDFDPAVGDALRHAVKLMPLLGWLRRLGLRRVKGSNLDPWDNFRALTMPCLLLRGALSDVLSPDITAKMRDIKPGMQVVEVADRGHAPTLDEPAARSAIDRFLAGLA